MIKGQLPYENKYLGRGGGGWLFWLNTTVIFKYEDCNPVFESVSIASYFYHRPVTVTVTATVTVTVVVITRRTKNSFAKI